MALSPALSRSETTPDETTPDYVLELAEFSVGEVVKVEPPRDRLAFGQGTAFGERPTMSRQLSDSRELRVRMEELASRGLLHRYVTGEESGWRDFVIKRLKRWTEVEECKESSIGSAGSDPAVLWTWDYADDQMPVWFEQFSLQERLLR